MKIGIITGSGLSASTVYRKSPNKSIIFKDININELLKSGHDNMDPIPSYREVVEWFKSQNVECGSVGCNTFDDIGMSLFKEYDIKPINSITNILFNTVRQYKEVGWLSTSSFRKKIPNDLKVKHISDNDQKIVDSIIFEQLAFGKVFSKSVQEICRIVDGLECKDVVFGCTDLSIMRNALDANIIDSVQLHLKSFS